MISETDTAPTTRTGHQRYYRMTAQIPDRHRTGHVTASPQWAGVPTGRLACMLPHSCRSGQHARSESLVRHRPCFGTSHVSACQPQPEGRGCVAHGAACWSHTYMYDHIYSCTSSCSATPLSSPPCHWHTPWRAPARLPRHLNLKLVSRHASGVQALAFAPPSTTSRTSEARSSPTSRPLGPRRAGDPASP